MAFGVTGDLMRLKILPALFALHEKNLLPTPFRIMGISRRSWSNAELRAHVAKVLGAAAASEALHSFLELFCFQQCDIEDPACFETLVSSIDILQNDSDRRPNVLMHLAIAPELYDRVFENLAAFQNPGETPWARIMIEKPFGYDLLSAQKLNGILWESFAESQIYRVDHYLAKIPRETLKTLRAYILENEIKHVHVRLLESVGVEKRAQFYDATGALKDVGQNHALEILALLTMDEDESSDVDRLRENRVAALRRLPQLSQDEVSTSTTRAQHVGYRDIPGVDPDSQTETYFEVHTMLSTPHAGNIGATIESGKRQPSPIKEIVLTRADGAMTRFSLDAKQDETEYERLIADCIRGDQRLFVSADEAEALWRFIDPIATAWKKNMVPLVYHSTDENK